VSTADRSDPRYGDPAPEVLKRREEFAEWCRRHGKVPDFPGMEDYPPVEPMAEEHVADLRRLQALAREVNLSDFYERADPPLKEKT
jgi:hypothetical protein